MIITTLIIKLFLFCYYYSETECLSPNFENESNRPVPEITEKNETSFRIEWNTPSADSNCHSVIVSTPPLIYTVYVNISGDDSIPGFPKVCEFITTLKEKHRFGHTHNTYT